MRIIIAGGCDAGDHARTRADGAGGWARAGGWDRRADGRFGGDGEPGSVTALDYAARSAGEPARHLPADPQQSAAMSAPCERPPARPSDTYRPPRPRDAHASDP